MEKIFDKVVKAIGSGASDAKLSKEGFEIWTYNIEHKKMVDGNMYRVIIYKLEDEGDIK